MSLPVELSPSRHRFGDRQRQRDQTQGTLPEFNFLSSLKDFFLFAFNQICLHWKHTAPFPLRGGENEYLPYKQRYGCVKTKRQPFEKDNHTLTNVKTHIGTLQRSDHSGENL